MLDKISIHLFLLILIIQVGVLLIINTLDGIIILIMQKHISEFPNSHLVVRLNHITFSQVKESGSGKQLMDGNLQQKNSLLYNQMNDLLNKMMLEIPSSKKNQNVVILMLSMDLNWLKYNAATFEDVKTGNRQTRNFNHLYAVAPTKHHEPLVKAGLTTSKGLLDVNIKTLQHNKYKNIFGLGDVNDLTTTNCFWAGFHQLHVAKNNIERNIAGQNTLTFLCHKYNNENAWHNLYFSNGGYLAALRYYNLCKNFKKAFIDIYLEKNLGPPYYKIKKSFKLPEGEKDEHGILSKFLPGKKESH